MSITAEDVRAAVRPIPATPAAAPLPDTEIQRLLKVLNQHSSDRASAPPGRPSVTRPRGSARTHNFDAALAQLGAEGHQVQHGAAEPVQAGDLERVAGAEQLEDQVELWPAGLGAAGGIEVDVVPRDAGPQQGVDLVVGVLVGGGDPRVAEQHPSTTAVTRGLSTLFPDPACRR